MQILKVTRQGCKTVRKYLVRCDCGNEYELSHRAYELRKEVGSTTCRKCNGNVSHKDYWDYSVYGRAAKMMEFVDRHWRP